MTYLWIPVCGCVGQEPRLEQPPGGAQAVQSVPGHHYHEGTGQ